MKPIKTVSVIPSLPPQLERLRDVALNLRWSWTPDAVALFRRLDDDLWETTQHNPVLMLGRIDQARLEDASGDEGFLVHLERVARDLDSYLHNSRSWFERVHGTSVAANTAGGAATPGASADPLVAYFSPEFGITDCLQIFAGGLGLLAGDHLKSASDLGVPLVALGLMYQQGYFRQSLNDAGWQQEYSEENDFFNLPLTLERDADGAPLVVSVPHPGREVHAYIWRAQVGRVAAYLLDTNIEANRQEDRDITDRLYGGDLETRIRQEIVLGIGGVRALRALGLNPTVYHMNEGHSAFLALERVRELMKSEGLTFAQASEIASAGLIFTTHTPVPAGHDAFPPYLIERYLADYGTSLGLNLHDLIALGRMDADDAGEPFGMTVLALRMAAYSNGVSRLHGEVSRQMWKALWPGLAEAEVPIGHVTNGVHLRSWVSDDLDQYFERYLGPRWRSEPGDEAIWQHANRIPPEELWRIHERRRDRLVSFARRRIRTQLETRGAAHAEINAAGATLDPEALTIGFARRFATYKRATLLFRDPERLARILNNPDRPVQIIFAGKAHPRDDAGKEFIREVVTFARQPQFRNRIIFLEDYDTEVARFLVQGCDVWLNNPRRPLEASGTSGMKAAANGVLNFSTLDGWWVEGWEASAGLANPVGWAIGRGEEYDNDDYQDQIEAEDLYDVLERDIIPTFYERGSDRLPRAWIARMHATIVRLCPWINAQRMVQEYTEKFYLPSAAQSRTLIENDYAGARSLAEWRSRIYVGWSQVRAEVIDDDSASEVSVGATVQVQALVNLGALSPDDVVVELYLGRVNSAGEIVEPELVSMRLVTDAGVTTISGRTYRYDVEPTTWRGSGQHGYTVRVLPNHPNLNTHFLPGLITWAG